MKTLEHFWYLDHSHSSKTKKLREDSERGNNFIIRHGLLPYNNYSTFGESYAISLQTSTFTKMPTTMIQKLKNYEMLFKWKFGVKKKMLLPKNMKVLHAGAGALHTRARPPQTLVSLRKLTVDVTTILLSGVFFSEHFSIVRWLFFFFVSPYFLLD